MRKEFALIVAILAGVTGCTSAAHRSGGNTKPAADPDQGEQNPGAQEAPAAKNTQTDAKSGPEQEVSDETDDQIDPNQQHEQDEQAGNARLEELKGTWRLGPEGAAVVLTISDTTITRQTGNFPKLAFPVEFLGIHANHPAIVFVEPLMGKPTKRYCLYNIFDRANERYANILCADGAFPQPDFSGFTPDNAYLRVD